MNRQSIHQQVDSLLKTIHDQHEQIKQHQGSIPQVEIDFMIQNLRQLFEASLLLNHTNALSSLDEVKAAITQKILAEKRAIEMKRAEEKPDAKKEVAIQEVQSKIEVIPVVQKEPVKEQPSTSEELIEKMAAPVSSEKQKDKIASTRKAGNLNSSMFEDKPTLGDKYGSEKSLHVTIAPKSASKTVAERLHKKPIKDLKAAIGINEKFLFINQLFEGNFQNYSQAIETIDALRDYDSAKKFVITELATAFHWDESNGHVINFMELVERRFIS